MTFCQCEDIFVFQDVRIVSESLLLRQIIDFLVEDSTNTSFCGDSLQELFDAIVCLRNVSMYLLPHLELSLPYEENVFIEATFFHYDLILIRFDRRHDIGKLIFCAYF